jgi:hypothetical protein
MKPRLNFITNKVTTEKKAAPCPSVGEIYVNDADGKVFIVAQCAVGMIAFIGLDDGNRWTDPVGHENFETDGFTKVIGDVTIVSK